MTRRTILFFIFFSTCLAQAQDTIPHLKGKVNISIKNGTMDCYFSLSNIPRIEDYVIRINSGMNIHYFKNPEYNNLLHYDVDRHDSSSSGESLAYFFAGPKRKGKFLPKELQMHYLGMYPVIADTALEKSVADWRGNVAFNGHSLRVDGYQSAWYPVLYDIKKQVQYEKLRYDVDITCTDCSSLYINGNKPIKGQKANFRSDKPEQLTLYCGDYEFSNIDGTYVLNPEMNEAQLNEFSSIVNSYKKYYENKLGIPYNGDITFVQTSPTAKGYGFLFVSYPTILNVSAGENGLKTIFDKKKGDFYKPYIAHELGHYYFGTSLRPNTVFGAIIDEGFTEYISLKLTREVIADSIYQKKVGGKITSLKSFSALPFARIKTKDDFSNRQLYVYNYAPIILTAIEREIGEKKMWQWLQTMLKMKTDYTDYEFVIHTLTSTLKNKQQVEVIRAKYLDSDQSLQNAFDAINQCPIHLADKM